MFRARSKIKEDIFCENVANTSILDIKVSSEYASVWQIVLWRYTLSTMQFTKNHLLMPVTWSNLIPALTENAHKVADSSFHYYPLFVL